MSRDELQQEIKRLEEAMKEKIVQIAELQSTLNSTRQNRDFFKSEAERISELCETVQQQLSDERNRTDEVLNMSRSTLQGVVELYSIKTNRRMPF